MKFALYIDGHMAKKFDLYGAYMFGSDGITIRNANIKFKDGHIICRKSNVVTAGLSLLWEVNGFGKVILSTTCLSDQEDACNLNVELARAKLMQIIVKREEWGLFGSLDSLEKPWQRSRDLLIQAIQNLSDGCAASKLADESLRISMMLSEKLAENQALSQFRVRENNRGFGKACLGCSVCPDSCNNTEYLEKLLKDFSFVTIPMPWHKIEVSEGKYDFSETDKCVRSLSGKKLVIGTGPLLCFSKKYLPDWLLEEEYSFDEIRDKAYEYVLKVVSKYSGIVKSWRVISGLNVFNHFGFNFEQVLEVTRASSMAVKAASDRGLKIIEICNPWGEYYGQRTGTIPPLVYMDMVVQSGINFDAFGVQIQMGRNEDGMHCRDMMQISSVLDYFGRISKPVYITDVEIPGSVGDDAESIKTAGYWREKWNEEVQGEWIEDFYRIALSKPFVDGVVYGNLCDNNKSLLSNSGLFRNSLEAKQSLKNIRKLRAKIFNR